MDLCLLSAPRDVRHRCAEGRVASTQLEACAIPEKVPFPPRFGLNGPIAGLPGRPGPVRRSGWRRGGGEEQASPNVQIANTFNNFVLPKSSHDQSTERSDRPLKVEDRHDSCKR